MGWLSPLLFWVAFCILPSSATDLTRDENERLLHQAWTHRQTVPTPPTIQEPGYTFPLSQRLQNRMLGGHIGMSIATCLGCLPLVIGVDAADWGLIALGAGMVVVGNLLRASIDGISYTRVSAQAPSVMQYLTNGLFQRAYLPSYLLQVSFGLFTYLTMHLLIGPTAQLSQWPAVLPVILAGVTTVALVGLDFYAMRRFTSHLRTVHSLI